MPGTDMCLKIGGWVRSEVTYGTNGSFDHGPLSTPTTTTATPTTSGRGNAATSRPMLASRRPTAWPAATSMSAFRPVTRQRSAGANFSSNRAFVQWAGFTAGLSVSFFDFYPAAALLTAPATCRTKIPATAARGSGATPPVRWWFLGGEVRGAPHQIVAQAEQRTFCGAGGWRPPLGGGGAAPGHRPTAWRSPATRRVRRLADARHHRQSACRPGLGRRAGHGRRAQLNAGLLRRPSLDRSSLRCVGLGRGRRHQDQRAVHLARRLFRRRGQLHPRCSPIPLPRRRVPNGRRPGTTEAMASAPTTAIGPRTTATGSTDHGWGVDVPTSTTGRRNGTRSVGAACKLRYTSTANSMLCALPRARGTGTGAGRVAAAGCNNNWDDWGVGSRLQWDVTKSFYIGVEALYSALDSASSANIGPSWQRHDRAVSGAGGAVSLQRRRLFRTRTKAIGRSQSAHAQGLPALIV